MSAFVVLDSTAGAQACAWDTVAQLTRLLDQAVRNGQSFRYSVEAGNVEGEPSQGPEGKRFATRRPTGGYEIHITIKPPNRSCNA